MDKYVITKPLMLTFDPNFQQDIQVGYVFCYLKVKIDRADTKRWISKGSL